MPRAIIRPGVKIFNVSCRSEGGVTYDREVLNVEHDGVSERKRLRTDVTVLDTSEHDRAQSVRSTARSRIVKETTPTPFGNVCLPQNFDAIRAAIAQSREEVEAFNRAARFTRLALYVFELDVPSDAEENARAIAQQFTSVMGAINSAIDRLDAKAIQQAAAEAQDLLSVVEAQQAAVVTEAITQARKAARDINRRIVKKGEEAAVVLKDIQRGNIEKARLAFLDMGDDLQVDAADSAPVIAQPAALDLGDDEEAPASRTEQDGSSDVATVAASAPETWA
jgi:hypothetical protein